MSDVTETSLGRYLKLKGGYSFKSSEFQNVGDVPVIKIGNVTGGGKVNLKDAQFLSKSVADRAKDFQTKPGDILIAMTGANVGKVARTSNSDPICAINQRVGKFELNESCPYSLDFIYYIVTSSRAYDFFSKAAYGSAQPNISGGLIESLKFNEIEPDAANEGGELLKSLDDKIELNQQMNETLETMAQALFKSWFVDFDPVRTKVEGREPEGMDKNTAALFPAVFNADGIPEGWERTTLEKVADLNSESWSNADHPDDVEYVDLANTKWGTIDSTQHFSWNDAPSRARRVLKPGDTIIGTVRPGNGSFSFVGPDGLTGSTGFAVLRPKKNIYRELVYYAAASVENIDRLSHLADGGAYPAVRPDVVLSTPLIFSGDKIMTAFSQWAAPLLDCAEANKSENQTLIKLRDTLLPKLISGELRMENLKGKQSN